MRLILPLAAVLALSALPALAQGDQPVDPILTQATVGGRTYTMNPLCFEESFLIGRTETLDGSYVTIQQFVRTRQDGWVAIPRYDTAETGDLVGAKAGASFCGEMEKS